MIHQLDIYGKDKVQTAIERLQNLQLAFPKIKEEGYFLAFSGGKDSVVIKALADMAEVKYDAHYQLTGIDPPELVRFIKREHPDVIIDIPRDKDGSQLTMWKLIVKKQSPPTRIRRYCCEYLKEVGGMGRIVVTGVRWAESSNRKSNQGLFTVIGKGKKQKKVAEIAEEKNANFTLTVKGGGGVQQRQRRDKRCGRAVLHQAEDSAEPHHRLGRLGRMGVHPGVQHPVLLTL